MIKLPKVVNQTQRDVDEMRWWITVIRKRLKCSEGELVNRALYHRMKRYLKQIGVDYKKEGDS